MTLRLFITKDKRQFFADDYGGDPSAVFPVLPEPGSLYHSEDTMDGKESMSFETIRFDRQKWRPSIQPDSTVKIIYVEVGSDFDYLPYLSNAFQNPTRTPQDAKRYTPWGAVE